MRITTWNVNGLRAAIRKGLQRHLDAIRPDVLLLQEIRAQPDQLPPEWSQPAGWFVAWHPAERKGYAGTAIFARRPLRRVRRGLHPAPDPEGRVLAARIAGTPLEVLSVYLPSGSASPQRQAAKEAWMDVFLPWSRQFLKRRHPVFLCGDLNIAHTERDIFYAKSNEKNSGFLPHEREWFGRLLDLGWVDVVRRHFGPIQGPYSWWSNRGRARELDRGWRIDYVLCNRPAAKLVRSAAVHREGGLEVSDHAPVSVDIELEGL